MKSEKNYPRSLEPPSADVVMIGNDLIQKAVDSSRNSPRKRITLPLHKSHSDNLHRMLNALQPGSYIQPHRHLYPPKAESIIVIRGAIICVEFSDSGEIMHRYRLSSESPHIGIDIEPGIYHTFFAIEEDTVIFEVKPGPYEQSSDKDFAFWAPAEGSQGAADYLRNLNELTIKPGDIR